MPDRALRKHPDSQIRKISRSLESFGWVSPILITPENEIVAGTARVMAARKLGQATAPALRVDHLTPEQVRLYRIADNRLAEEADWDRDTLRLEIAELIDLDVDDQVDSISQFLKWIRDKRGRTFLSTKGESGSLRDEFGRYPAFFGTR